MPDKKGTGKHPHKSSTRGEASGSGGAGTARAKEKEEMTGQASDLKEREYKDSKGQIHQHTKNKK